MRNTKNRKNEKQTCLAWSFHFSPSRANASVLSRLQLINFFATSFAGGTSVDKSTAEIQEKILLELIITRCMHFSHSAISDGCVESNKLQILSTHSAIRHLISNSFRVRRDSVVGLPKTLAYSSLSAILMVQIYICMYVYISGW